MEISRSKGNLTSPGFSLWSEVTPATEGKRDTMSGKTKKAPQLTLKEKRAAKREKNAPAEFIKPRKGAKG